MKVQVCMQMHFKHHRALSMFSVANYMHDDMIKVLELIYKAPIIFITQIKQIYKLKLQK
jgi:hypothetical protein